VTKQNNPGGFKVGALKGEHAITPPPVWEIKKVVWGWVGEKDTSGARKKGSIDVSTSSFRYWFS